MENWQFFSDSRFALQFKYPILATDGEPVERMETQHGGMLQVHILSPGSREVYFEVTKYDLLTPQAEYQRHAESLPKQFGAVEITELGETRCTSLTASEYSFEWDQGKRIVILVELDGATYRILYNPRFSVNQQILDTVEWLSLT